MKKLLFVMLAAFVCVSCSKDESDLAPNDGQYIARSGDMVVCMQLKGGRCSYFAPYIKDIKKNRLSLPLESMR